VQRLCHCDQVHRIVPHTSAFCKPLAVGYVVSLGCRIQLFQAAVDGNHLLCKHSCWVYEVCTPPSGPPRVPVCMVTRRQNPLTGQGTPCVYGTVFLRKQEHILEVKLKRCVKPPTGHRGVILLSSPLSASFSGVASICCTQCALAFPLHLHAGITESYMVISCWKIFTFLKCLESSTDAWPEPHAMSNTNPGCPSQLQYLRMCS